MKDKLTGLTVYIFTTQATQPDKSSCSIAGNYTEAILVSVNGKHTGGSVEVSESCPAVYIEEELSPFGDSKGKRSLLIRAYPEAKETRTKHYMSSGTFIYNPDSRFPYSHPVMLIDQVNK